ncbi:MAG: DNA repair protein RadC [Archaeoglobaceae archaeon]
MKAVTNDGDEIEGMEDRQEAIDFLVENRAYPVYRNGNIFFTRKRKNPLFNQYKERIIQKLELNTEEDCREVREIIKQEVKKSRITKPIKDWVEDERPREMLIKYGPQQLSSSKLLAVILRVGNEGVSAEDLGRNLLNHFGSLRAVDDASINQLCQIQGIGMAKAAQIKAAIETGKRMMREGAEKRNKVRNVSDVVDYVFDYYSPYLKDAKKEFFNIILLDSGNKPVKNLELSKGGLETNVVDVREVVRETSKEGAASIILVHNHPSGEPEPSGEDINVTKRIVEACNLVGVRVLDHIILGKDRENYTSFLEKGLLGN